MGDRERRKEREKECKGERWWEGRGPARREGREMVPVATTPLGNSPCSGLPGSPLIKGPSCPRTVVFKPQGRVQIARRK